jgi:hypothetical protein
MHWWADEPERMGELASVVRIRARVRTSVTIAMRRGERGVALFRGGGGFPCLWPNWLGLEALNLRMAIIKSGTAADTTDFAVDASSRKRTCPASS